MSLSLKELQKLAEDILPHKHGKKTSKDNTIVSGTGGKTNYRVLPNLRFAYAMPLVLLVAGIGVYSLLFSQAAVAPTQVTFEGGSTSPCTGGVNITPGNTSFTPTTNKAYEGSYSAEAKYTGGGQNAYARCVITTSWNTGDDVYYGGAFFLPTGFTASMQNQVDLMRWDNFSLNNASQDWGGLIIQNSDKKARLKKFNVDGDYTDLSTPFAFPENRWVWVEMRQKLSPTDGQAINEVWIDGALQSSSTTANTYGREITRIRHGLVAIGEGSQTNPLNLWVDRATISTSKVGPLGGSAGCTTTLNNGANIATSLSSVASGGTICLNPGSYTYSAGTINKNSMTTVKAAPGVTASQINLNYVDVQTSSNLHFEGITINGAATGTGSATASNIEFVGITFTGGVCLNVPGTNSSRGILVDSSTFINVGQSCNEGRLTVNGRNTSHSSGFNQGITISNNLFKGSGASRTGCSDGIQLTGEASGVTISGNEFWQIKEHPNDYGYQSFDCDNATTSGSPCGAGSVPTCDDPHVDPIQIYGASYVTLTGNYFHQNSTGLMSADCNGSPLNVTDNIWTTDGEYGDQAILSGATSSTFSHNTLADGSNFRTSGNGCSSFSGTVTNNIIGGLTGNAPSGTVDYNLTAISSLRGTHGINNSDGMNNSPVFTGGANPSSWAGYQLTSTSPGHAAASDTKDMGATTFGTSSTPADTTPPTTTLNTTAAGTPTSSTTSTSATFTFSANETATFQCKLDTAAYASCSSPKAFTGLAVGSHTFSVKATDTAGNAETTAKTYTWTITTPTSTCPTKAGDVNGDGSVNITDIGLVLSAYGQTTTTNCADLDKSGTVNIQDLSIILSRYGT